MAERSRDDQFRSYVIGSRGRLLRTATLLSSGNADEAEDLVQTVLMRMYLSWPRIRSETRDAYARRMLVNAHLDERRRPHARPTALPGASAASVVRPLHKGDRAGRGATG
jgi:DNA-directed RNA polymerase specialized sigma24 family protein